MKYVGVRREIHGRHTGDIWEIRRRYTGDTWENVWGIYRRILFILQVGSMFVAEEKRIEAVKYVL